MEYNTTINTFLGRLLDKSQITPTIFSALTTEEARTPAFYLLPKIHKGTTPVQGRPIVSGKVSPTEKISAFVDFLMKPYITHITSYVQDSNHVLEYLHQYRSLPPGTILASLDVSLLYTNIPNDEGIHACQTFLDPYVSSMSTASPSILEREISNEGAIELLKIVLTMNNFRFNGQHFLQVGGTTMGTRVAPTFANVYMDSF